MADLDIDDALVRKLAKLMDETGLTEIEYEFDDHRIRVARTAAAVQVSAPAPGAVVPIAAAASAAEGIPAGAVTSPMVGTVYLAGEPGATPFVKAGDQVSEGQTLLIVEAMKVMNPLPSPRSGTVTAVLVGDGDPVEFGEPLLVIG